MKRGSRRPGEGDGSQFPLAGWDASRNPIKELKQWSGVGAIAAAPKGNTRGRQSLPSIRFEEAWQ